MIAWPEEFCEGLAARGFHVIRFDNRDCGRSTHLDEAPTPTLRELITRRIKRPAYTLDDMARDAAGLLEGLGIERAHVVGASMGAMIAQTLALLDARARHLARIDHGQHRRPHLRAAQPAPVASAARPPPADRTSLRRAGRRCLRARRLAGLRARRADPARAARAVVRPWRRRRRLRAATRSDIRVRLAPAPPAPDHRADARDPRQRRPARRLHRAAARPHARSRGRTC